MQCAGIMRMKSIADSYSQKFGIYSTKVYSTEITISSDPRNFSAAVCSRDGQLTGFAY